MLVISREYKVIVDGALFADPAAGLGELQVDLADLAAAAGLTLDGAFDADEPKERSICFLDTPDHTLRQSGLLLRQRIKLKSGKTEYTLKLRTEDRYVAAGAPLSAGAGFKPEEKFEEDIGVPFVSRFSRSTTVAIEADGRGAGDDLPGSLGEAARLFPGLLAVRRDGAPCPPVTPLAPVNRLHAFERVYEGPTVRFPMGPTTATTALILWRKGKKGRLLTAEFSFRYGDEDEAYPPAVARAARLLFDGVQRQDWARPEAQTKTQYLYGGQ